MCVCGYLYVRVFVCVVYVCVSVWLCAFYVVCINYQPNNSLSWMRPKCHAERDMLVD